MTYTFRVTSYIWTASYVFVGYYLFKDFFTKTNSYILFGVLVIYAFGTGNYPDILINLFKQIADKFTFKASDMVLAIIITNLIGILNVLKDFHIFIF